MGGTVAVDLAVAGDRIARDGALVFLPGRTVVDFVVAPAVEQFTLFFLPALVAAAKFGSALIKAVFVRAAIERLLVGVTGHAFEYT